ncbi:SdpA family antimicrobial peptide system protein [uncultured Arthrobacter sp.]|uniref:SdpA family antimicrobial peptide system protein n=1 Tax=uncultured Arthrobacter sp. TaxID=114050 RepID=UPI002603F691|nr:SdpA family antimicrobial peptide system protein [uncultured Arthrobacter sp.]
MKIRHTLLPSTLLGVFALYSGLASLDATVLDPPGLDEKRVEIMSVAPQGWSFFTKSPRDPQIEPFAASDSTLESVAGFPNTRAENLFGLSRHGRSQGVETALLMAALPDANWITCDSPALDTCAEDLMSSTLHPVTNTVPSPSLCGEIVLVESTPVAWSYRDHTELSESAESGLRMDVKC